MAKYTVRITNDAEGIKAWVDQDGEICIMQPHAPGKTEPWATEAEAQEWGNKHAAELQRSHDDAVAEVVLKKEREEAAHQANLAMVAILERLTNPTA
jgi:hypothetical protein